MQGRGAFDKAAKCVQPDADEASSPGKVWASNKRRKEPSLVALAHHECLKIKPWLNEWFRFQQRTHDPVVDPPNSLKKT